MVIDVSHGMGLEQSVGHWASDEGSHGVNHWIRGSVMESVMRVVMESVIGSVIDGVGHVSV